MDEHEKYVLCHLLFSPLYTVPLFLPCTISTLANYLVPLGLCYGAYGYGVRMELDPALPWK